MFFSCCVSMPTRLSSYGPSTSSATLTASITAPSVERRPPGEQAAAVGDAEHAGDHPHHHVQVAQSGDAVDIDRGCPVMKVGDVRAGPTAAASRRPGLGAGGRSESLHVDEAVGGVGVRRGRRRGEWGIVGLVTISASARPRETEHRCGPGRWRSRVTNPNFFMSRMSSFGVVYTARPITPLADHRLTPEPGAVKFRWQKLIGSIGVESHHLYRPSNAGDGPASSGEVAAPRLSRGNRSRASSSLVPSTC